MLTRVQNVEFNTVPHVRTQCFVFVGYNRFFCLCTDVYVKVYMLHKGRRVARKQSRVVHCPSPSQSACVQSTGGATAVFNEAFLFDLAPNQSPADTVIEFTLIDWNRTTKDEVVGRLVVRPFGGRGSVGEVGAWGDDGKMQQQRAAATGATPTRGDRQVAVWHKLGD